jgi:hypothetical protein
LLNHPSDGDINLLNFASIKLFFVFLITFVSLVSMTLRLTFLILNFLLLYLSCLAQDGHVLIQTKNPQTNRIIELADSLFPNQKGNFKIIDITESPLGFHYTLVQQCQGIDIFDTYLKLHVNANKKLYHYQYHLFEGEPNTQTTSNDTMDLWIIANKKLIKSKYAIYNDSKQKPWFALIKDKDTTQRFPMFLPFKDSMVKAKVYLPNPITSSHSKYGNLILDLNDANSPALEAELKSVNVITRFDNGLFYLQNDHLTLTDISSPNYSITNSALPQFNYNRSQYQFEDINAFYHLSIQIDYLKKLGFNKIIPNIKVDTHALQGADQSLFKFLSKPNSIEYGTGGVDDAEDAEVVVHEYGHALSQTASPNTTINASPERLAMEEGWADYLAVSHFKKQDEYNWERIFDWDGHNEFWDGINTNTNKKYPEDLTKQRDEDRELWSTPLLCLSDKLGKAKADSLLLQLLYFQTNDATMPQMAEKLIYIDTLFFYGDNYREIKSCFLESGILHKDHRDLFQGDVRETTDYRLVNTSGFAQNNGPMGIKFNHKVDCIFSVYDLYGKLIMQQNYNRTDLIFLEPEQLKSGVYVMQIEPHMNTKGFRNFYVREKVVKW